MNAIILLIDESTLMDAQIKLKDASRKPLHKMKSVANSVNGFLQRVRESQPSCKLALLGYSTDSEDNAVVESKLGESLVSVSDLDSLVRRVETRTRKIPSGDGITFKSLDVDVSIWYEPHERGNSCQVAGFEFAKGFLSKCNGVDSVTLIHVFGGASSDGNPVRCVKSFQDLGLKSLTIFQLHVGSTESVPASTFPTNQATLTTSLARDLFNRATPLDETWRDALREKGFAVGISAQSLIYNAHLVDLARVLASVEAVAGTWQDDIDLSGGETEPESDEAESSIDVVPVPSDEAIETSGDEVSIDETEATSDNGSLDLANSDDGTLPARQLVVLAIDCSVEDPFASSTKNVVSSHATNMGTFLQQVLKRAKDDVDIGIVSYSSGADGSENIQSRIESAPASPYFPANEVESLALRIDSGVDELSDGAGGLIKIPYARPVLIELEASTYCPPINAFTEVAEIVNDWQTKNKSILAPIVVHLTRGEFASGDLEAATIKLKELATSDSVVVYHWVSTAKRVEVMYASPSLVLDEDGAFLNEIIALSSPLQNADQIHLENSNIVPDAVGLVCNSRFDHILDSLTRLRESTGSVL